jgi:hypothetical protein
MGIQSDYGSGLKREAAGTGTGLHPAASRATSGTVGEMNFIQRKLEYWLADHYHRSSGESLRAFGLHKRRWIGKLAQRREFADPQAENRSVQPARREDQDH